MGQSNERQSPHLDAFVVEDKFEKAPTTDKVVLIGNDPENNKIGNIGNVLTQQITICPPEMASAYIQTAYTGNQFIVYIDKNTQHHLIAGEQYTNQYPILKDSDIMRLNEIKVKIIKIYMNPIRDKFFWITNDNQVFASGTNQCGELGVDSVLDINVPQIVKKLCDRDITDIQFGDSYSIVLSKENKQTAEFVVEYWCRKERYNAIPNDVIKLMIIYYECYDVYSTTYCAFGGNGHSINDQNNVIKSFKRITTFDNINVVKISAGSMHSMFLDSNGILWTSGYDWPGYCGIGDRFSIYKPMQLTYFVANKIKINNVKCGGKHTLAVDENGRIYGWGINSKGQCGENNVFSKVAKPKLIKYFDEDIICDIDCGYQHSYCKTSDNKHYLWGDNNKNQCMCDQKIVIAAKCINKIMDQRGMKIKSICLGYNDTKLIVTEN